MARLHELKYHEDTVEKRGITKEDLDFLMDLQKEMNTQDTVCQADPRFWVIAGTEKEYGFDPDYADGFTVYDEDSQAAESMEELAGYILDNVLPISDDYEDEVEYSEFFKCINIETEDDNVELSTPDEVCEWLNEHGHNFSVSYYKNKRNLYPGTMFLTHKDAMKHLDDNHYHYSNDAHTYALTAHRSASVEKLYKILQEVDWESIKMSERSSDNERNHE